MSSSRSPVAISATMTMPMTSERSPNPLAQLVLARVREFYRQPETIFWVYGFPIILAIGLGIAFRQAPVVRVHVDVLEGEGAGQISELLQQDARFVVSVSNAAAARRRLRTGRTSLVIDGSGGSDTSGLELEYWLDPTRPESVLARQSADDALQRASGREDVARVRDIEIQEPGARYIDFLIPGILGMNLMGGGLWGVGFVTVDMRIRKLLKRFVATPMKKSHFLIAIMFSRMLFMIPEIFILLVFARYAFGVLNYGSWLALFVVILLGAVTFSGIGLLVASRAKTLETVSGLMNLVMLPMWLLGGIFFSYERFPEVAQPFIRALPLTALNDALRALMLEGLPLASQGAELVILSAYAVVTFGLALRWFRWT